MFLIMPSFNIFYQIVSYIIFMFVLIPFYVIGFVWRYVWALRIGQEEIVQRRAIGMKQLINPDVDKT
jgi:hypothetical protein